MLTLYIEAPTWTKLQEEIARVMGGVAPAEGTAELTFTAERAAFHPTVAEAPKNIAKAAIRVDPDGQVITGPVTPGENTHESAAPKKRRGRPAKTEQPEAGAGTPSGRREAVLSPAATPAPTPSADDLRAAFERVASTADNGMEVCLNLLQNAGYKFVREVKPEDRAALIEQCDAAVQDAVTEVTKGVA